MLNYVGKGSCSRGLHLSAEAAYWAEAGFQVNQTINNGPLYPLSRHHYVIINCYDSKKVSLITFSKSTKGNLLNHDNI